MRGTSRHRRAARALPAAGALATLVALAGCETRVVRETGYGPGSAFNTPHQWEDEPKKKNQPSSFPNPFAAVGDAIGGLFNAMASPFRGLSKPDPAPSASSTNFNGDGVVQAADGHQYKVRFENGKVISSEPRLDSSPAK